MKRPVTLALLVLLLFGTFLSFVPAGGTGATLPGALPGMQAPVFDLATTDGGRVALADLRGKPVLINFWATWCEACRREAPDLRRLYAGAGGAYTIVGVDDDEPPERVLLFAQQQGYGWTIGLDTGGRTMAAYGVHYLPTSFFVDATGVIRRTFTGQMTLGQMRAYMRDAGA